MQSCKVFEKPSVLSVYWQINEILECEYFVSTHNELRTVEYQINKYFSSDLEKNEEKFKSLSLLFAHWIMLSGFILVKQIFFIVNCFKKNTLYINEIVFVELTETNMTKIDRNHKYVNWIGQKNKI